MLELSNNYGNETGRDTIEIFSAGCQLCRHVIEDIQIGKCYGCNQIIYYINKMTDDIKRKIKDDDATSVPTIIIEDSIKVVGIPDLP
jgi:hypothetical protein